MATTDVNICNAALIKVGASTITTLGDDTKNARACNERYADLRDSVLAAHPWNFAIERVELVDIAGFVNNGRFSTGIQDWADESTGASEIAWEPTNKTLVLTAVANNTVKASQVFVLTATTTVKIKATLSATDATVATDNWLAIGTTAGAFDSLRAFFTGISAGEDLEAEVTLVAGTYYTGAGALNAANAVNSEIDDFSLTDISGLNDVYDYLNRFTLPSDLLRIIDTNMDNEEFKIVKSGELIADVKEIKIRYIKQVTDISLWDPLATEALASRIGAELALHLVDSDSRRQVMEALYEKQMRQARFADSQQGTADLLPDGSWLDSRLGWVSKPGRIQ